MHLTFFVVKQDGLEIKRVSNTSLPWCCHRTRNTKIIFSLNYRNLISSKIHEKDKIISHIHFCITLVYIFMYYFLDHDLYLSCISSEYKAHCCVHQSITSYHSSDSRSDFEVKLFDSNKPQNLKWNYTLPLWNMLSTWFGEIHENEKHQYYIKSRWRCLFFSYVQCVLVQVSLTHFHLPPEGDP